MKENAIRILRVAIETVEEDARREYPNIKDVIQRQSYKVGALMETIKMALEELER